MRANTTRERLLASTVMFGAAALSMTAGAASGQTVQTAQNTTAAPSAAEAAAPIVGAPDASQATSVKEVVVTGSRIAQKGLTSPSPLAVVNSQEIKLEGTTNVESLINNLPQAYAAQTSQLSNGSTGTATVNLRDLGSTHTLVLVDGRRLMPGDPGTPSADLNNIPAQLVDRVEVTTGGASAIYGSDAVAGVVNFIMKHDFQGVQIDAQGGFAQHTNGPNSSVDSAIAAFNVSNPQSAVHVPSSVVDGRTLDVTAMFGANTPDDKGNVTAYAEYRNMQPITQDTRSFSACSISSAVSTTPKVADTHICAGSSNTQFGHFVVTSLTSPTGTNIANTTATLAGRGVNTGTLSDNPNGTNTFVPYTSALAFNFGPYNYIQREDDRYTAGYFAHYRVNEHFDLYSDFMFADDHTVSAIAPSGLFQGVGANGASTVGVNCNNPLLSASQAAALCGNLAGTSNIANLNAAYRFANGGAPRINDLRHTDYKIDIGSKGDLAPGWSYDAYLQYGTSIYSEEYRGDVSLAKAQNSLLVNPTTGACTSGGTCVPLNIFNVNGLTPGAVGYVATPGFQEGDTVEQVASASITGDLGQYGVKSPFATDGLGVAFGTEYRRENLSLNTDQEFTSGDLAGQGGPRIGNSGTFDVYELFGEGRLPLVQDKPFIKNLSLDGAYRFSQYSTAGRTDTYEGQFTYAPTSDLSFRGGYSRAVRAPNVNELFAAQSIGNYSGTDPCAGSAPTATLAQCQRTGVTAAEYGNIIPCPAGQCSQLTGGNKNLQPEKADTITLGAVFTPTFLRGFSLTVDWFDIKIDGLIVSGVGGAAVTLTQCLQTGTPIYCNLIHRDTNTGILFGNSGFITATKVNTGFERTEGIDVAANYHFRPTDWLNIPNVGAFDLSMQGTYTTEFVRQPVSGGGAYDCAGLYGSDHCGDPIPNWRHRARLTWSPPMPFTLSLQWRFIGSTEFDGNSTNNFLHQTNFNAVDAKIPAYNYVDFSATYRIKDGLTARMGINNLADKDPPVLDSNNFPASGPSLGNGNTFPGVYDSLGRTFFFGITADF
ncbi:TonB-dependent receptor domain-containing protein [Caulobacter sp. S45]|uniref:TonB-dependent receptor domain-containing protein n=1 Tax=Caulobacter sp. S45 TaxID=1641861 RepID=UPI00131BCBD8|nr:TonB-dependent receptor [Caulobacter sp. S45]